MYINSETCLQLCACVLCLALPPATVELCSKVSSCNKQPLYILFIVLLTTFRHLWRAKWGNGPLKISQASTNITLAVLQGVPHVASTPCCFQFRLLWLDFSLLFGWVCCTNHRSAEWVAVCCLTASRSLQGWVEDCWCLERGNALSLI